MLCQPQWCSGHRAGTAARHRERPRIPGDVWGSLRTSDVPCRPLSFLADSSSPLQLPAQLEWLQLVARDGDALHSDLCPKHVCCGHWVGSGSVSASTETFLNSFYPHHFKGEATSKVMQ